jgi:hypothetical protein
MARPQETLASSGFVRGWGDMQRTGFKVAGASRASSAD